MNNHYLLLFMISCYIIPILYVYFTYNSNASISNIICNPKCKYFIMFFMLLMGIGTILYEVERNDMISIIVIILLLAGIYGVLSINEKHYIHYFFAFIVFISMLIFMVRQCCLKNCENILLLSLLTQLILLLTVIINISDDIFSVEVLYILNFAFFYLYLHFSTQ